MTDTIRFYSDYEISHKTDNSLKRSDSIEVQSVSAFPTSHSGAFAASFTSVAFGVSSFDASYFNSSSCSYNDIPSSLSFENFESFVGESKIDYSNVVEHIETEQIKEFWLRYNEYPQYLKKVKKRNKRKAKKNKPSQN